MAQITITFETSADVVSGLDHAAAIQHRDRSAILEDAIFQYLASDQEFVAWSKKASVRLKLMNSSTTLKSSP